MSANPESPLVKMPPLSDEDLRSLVGAFERQNMEVLQILVPLPRALLTDQEYSTKDMLEAVTPEVSEAIQLVLREYRGF